MMVRFLGRKVIGDAVGEFTIKFDADFSKAGADGNPAVEKFISAE